MSRGGSPMATETTQETKARTRLAPRFHLVLLDDDDHTYEYVIEMLGALFGHPPGDAFRMAEEVDASGRVIVFTAHLELVELKQDQIHAYGADPRIRACAGSMTAVIEPAPT